MSEEAEYQILDDEKLETWDTVIYERRRFYDYEINGKTVAVPVYELADIEDEEIDNLVRGDELCPGCLNWHSATVLETCEADETGYKFDICRCDEAGDTPVIFGQYWKKRITVEVNSGIIVDRTWEFAEPDPEVKVTFQDGYSIRFWEQGLTNKEYIRRALLIRQEEIQTE